MVRFVITLRWLCREERGMEEKPGRKKQERQLQLLSNCFPKRKAMAQTVPITIVRPTNRPYTHTCRGGNAGAVGGKGWLQEGMLQR